MISQETWSAIVPYDRQNFESLDAQNCVKSLIAQDIVHGVREDVLQALEVMAKNRKIKMHQFKKINFFKGKIKIHFFNYLFMIEACSFVKYDTVKFRICDLIKTNIFII